MGNLISAVLVLCISMTTTLYFAGYEVGSSEYPDYEWVGVGVSFFVIQAAFMLVLLRALMEKLLEK